MSDDTQDEIMACLDHIRWAKEKSGEIELPDVEKTTGVDVSKIYRFVEAVSRLSFDATDNEVARLFDQLGPKEKKFVQTVFTDQMKSLVQKEVTQRPVERPIDDDTPLMSKDDVQAE